MLTSGSRQAAALSLALALSVFGNLTSRADVLKPDYQVIRVDAPKTMAVGISDSFAVIVGNIGNMRGTVEVDLPFGGGLELTDQVVADGGLACSVDDGASLGVVTLIHCTGASLEPQRSLTISLKGRANTAGEGYLYVLINRSKSVNEHDDDNNAYTEHVTIN